MLLCTNSATPMSWLDSYLSLTPLSKDVTTLLTYAACYYCHSKLDEVFVSLGLPCSLVDLA
jgi:hypothetical protein